MSYTSDMFPLFSRKHRHTTNEVALIFDIGSGNVGAALALLSNSHKPILLATERAALSSQGELRAKRLQPLMLRALSEAVLSLLAEGIPRAGLSARRLKITDAFYILAAPWCSPSAKTLSLAQKEPLRITEEVISELVRHEDGHDAEVPDGAASTKRRPVETSKRFERLFLSARLNGYETGAPLGKEARSAAFSFFESRAPSSLLRAIADTVAHFVHPRRVRFHSFALASFSALHELFPDAGDFLFADIGGEITEVLVVKQKKILNALSFPSGRNHLIRAIADATGSAPGAAHGLLALAREKQLHEGERKSATDALTAFCGNWRARLLQTISSFSSALPVPPTVFLSADEDCADFFAECIKGAADGDESLGGAPPVVTVLQAKNFHPLVVVNAASAAADPFLMLETVYANQLRRSYALSA